jgi:hypothetical protein
VLQVVSKDAPADGKPVAVIAADASAAEGADCLVFQWGNSPLFPHTPRHAHAVQLPRLVPRSYGIGPLSEGSDLLAVDGAVAGTLPSRGGTAHLKSVPKEVDLVALQNLTELRGKPREFVRRP